MTVVEIARPPGDPGKPAGKLDDVLPCATADLKRIAGLSGKVSLQNATDGLVVAVKGGRIKPSVGLATATIFTKFNDVFGHLRAPIPKFA